MKSLKTLVRNIPGLVAGVRLSKRMIAIYRRLITIKQGDLISSEPHFKIIAISDRRHRFVGYYDHSPFKPDDDDILLVHSTERPSWRHPSPDVPVRIELINHRDNSIICELGESYAWNWQQGARALWLNSETVIYNIYDITTGRYKARMVMSDGTHLGDLPIPVQEVDTKGRVYSLSYETLALVRPDYGYRNHKSDVKQLADDAIEQFNPYTQKHNVLVRLSTLTKQTEARYGCSISQAKFNHVMVSPNADCLVFLFRYFVNGRRVTDLYEMSTDGVSIRILVADNGVSHVCWWGNDNLVATMMGADGFGYYLIQRGSRSLKFLWAQQDGHPSHIDSSRLLTDTYPDRLALRRLLICSLDTGKVAELGAFPEPLLFQGQTRCDLHPSVSLSGKYIQVDCAVGHHRCVAILASPLYNEGNA